MIQGVLYMRDNIKGGALTETTLLVLLALYEPRHGYGINKFIEEKTDGRVSLGAGTLYNALDTLVKKQWIIPCGEDSRKKDYVITDDGKRIVDVEKARLKQIIDILSSIVGTHTEHT